MDLHKNILEDISQRELADVEVFADRLFGKLGIDVEFTRHFLERLNDERNGKPVSPAELISMFKKEYEQYGKKLQGLKDEVEAVFMDLTSNLNLPFVIKDRRDLKQLVGKTIMRKANFRTPDPAYKVR